MAKVIIPTPLRKFTDDRSTLESNGKTVREVIQDLGSHFPGLKKHLFNSDGTIRSFIRIFVDEDDIMSLKKDETEVRSNSVVSIIPAIAGGINQ